MKDDKLQQPLNIEWDEKYGPYIVLSDFEHADYIDDVLTEIYDFTIWCLSENNETGKYTYYLGLDAPADLIEDIIGKINKHHSESREIYVLD